jgi:excisionase family DNA binding protein
MFMAVRTYYAQISLLTCFDGAASCPWDAAVAGCSMTIGADQNREASLLTLHEVAELLKVPDSWVYCHTRSRCADPLPGYRIGKYWRFRAEEVFAWVRRHRTNFRES